MHVTLRFLGELEPARIPALIEPVRAGSGALAPFMLRLGRLASLPPGRRARVLVLELAPEAPLAALAQAVERGVVAAGCAPETRAYRGHLTLGRLREGARPPALDALEVPPASFEVAESVLFSSELTSSGSRYRALERIALCGDPGASTHHP
jgi:2'-5' RNA ligase